MFHPLPQDERPPRWLAIQNDSGEEAPACGLIRVTGGGTAGAYTGAKPDADGGYVWVLSGEPLPNGFTGAAAPDGPVCVLYDEADGTPLAGEEWGAASGSWKLRKNKTGWRILGGAGAGLVNAVRAACCDAAPGTAAGQVPAGDGTGDLQPTPVFVTEDAKNGDPASQIRQFISDSVSPSSTSEPQFFQEFAADQNGTSPPTVGWTQALYTQGTAANPAFSTTVGTLASGVAKSYEQTIDLPAASGSPQHQQTVTVGPGGAQTVQQTTQTPTQYQQAVSVNGSPVFSLAVGAGGAVYTGAIDFSGATVTGLAGGSGPTWTKYTVGYAAVAALGATTSGTVTVATLGTKVSIHNAVIKPAVAWGGGTITALSLELDYNGDVLTPSAAGLTVSATNWAQAVAPTVNFGGSATVSLVAVSTGDDLDALTAGSVEVWLLTSTLP